MAKNAFYYSEFTNENGILAFLNGVLLCLKNSKNIEEVIINALFSLSNFGFLCF